MIILGLIIFTACMIWAAVNDVATMKIPNVCVGLLLASFVIIAPFSELTWSAIGLHWATGFAALVVCFALFSFNVLGAGDGKLIAAAAVWLGPIGTVNFVLAFALLGGVLGLGLILFRSWPMPLFIATNPVAMALHGSKKEMPFGLAIAPGALFALSESPWASTIMRVLPI